MRTATRQAGMRDGVALVGRARAAHGGWTCTGWLLGACGEEGGREEGNEREKRAASLVVVSGRGGWNTGRLRILDRHSRLGARVCRYKHVHIALAARAAGVVSAVPPRRALRRDGF